MAQTTDILIIGAGQSGLAASYRLSVLGVDHVVLERSAAVGERWRDERPNGLRLLTPNWLNGLPGAPYRGDDPNGFMSGSAFGDRLAQYANQFALPVHHGTQVLDCRRSGAGFHVSSTKGDWRTRAVIVATGACDTPFVPEWASRIPGRVPQFTPRTYRVPDQIQTPTVIVIGASATGVQCAHEMRAAGLEVYLSVGRHVRTPRSYRGKDIFEWLYEAGVLDDARDESGFSPLVHLPSMQLRGIESGDPEDIDLAILAEAGVSLLGRAEGFECGAICFSDDLCREIRAAEARRLSLLSRIDPAAFPSDRVDCLARELPDRLGSLGSSRCAIGLGPAGRYSIFWATGYRRDYTWLNLPVLDAKGEILNRAGVTSEPGLFVVGLPFMTHRASSFICGTGRDAKAVANAAATFLDQSNLSAA